MSATLRLDLPDDLIERLRRQAERHGRTLEEEAISVLAVHPVGEPAEAKAAALDRAAALRRRIRNRLGHDFATGSDTLIVEDRASR